MSKRARRDAGVAGEAGERRRTVSTQMRNERWAKTFVRWFHIDDDDAMKVARTKAQLKHLKTKRKKAADKKKRRQQHAAAVKHVSGALAAGDIVMDGAVADDGGDVNHANISSGRMKQSNLTARKRELRERIADLKSKRSKIAKKNFGKSDERKSLTNQIKELERQRAELVKSGGGSDGNVGDIDGDEEDLVVDDEDEVMAG